MNLLLDTNIALWWLADDPSLSEKVRSHIIDTGNAVFVSAVTVWEVAIKASIGKLEIDGSWLDELMSDGFQRLPVKWSHAEGVRHLPAAAEQGAGFVRPSAGWQNDRALRKAPRPKAGSRPTLRRASYRFRFRAQATLRESSSRGLHGHGCRDRHCRQAHGPQ